MGPGEAADGEGFDVAYLVLSGTTTAARCPELLRGLVGLGFSSVIALPTPNASRVVAARELADVVRAVQLQFAQQAGARHRRQPRLVGGRRGDRTVHAGDRRAIAERAAVEPPRGAGVAQEAAELGRHNRAAGRRGRGTAPRSHRTAARCGSPVPPSRLTPLTRARNVIASGLGGLTFNTRLRVSVAATAREKNCP